MKKIFFPLFLFLLFSIKYVESKVEPPNYDFSLDKFQDFMPKKTRDEIEKKYPKSTVVYKKGDFQIKRYYVAHIRYRFPIFVQFHKGIVIDFFARLPQYFLHDIFHQSLINRIGKQDIYKKLEEQAVYIWKNKTGNKHIYSGACTITCYPIFYSVNQVENLPKSYTSTFQFLENERLKNKESKD